MSLRFRRALRIAPGVRLNLGLHGAGLSLGPRGLHVGVNRRGMYSWIGSIEIPIFLSGPGGCFSACLTLLACPALASNAVHHFHSLCQPHPEVQSVAGPALIGVLLALLIAVVVVIAANSR